MLSGSFIAGFVCLSFAVLFGQRTTINFATDDPGRPPKGFAFVLTGQGRPGVWLVRKDDAAHGNVLVQTDADPTDNRFPVAVYDFTARDVDLTVQFKPVSGEGIKVPASSGGTAIRTTTTSRGATRSRTRARSTAW